MTWPFDRAENVAAITTVRVLEEAHPILVVQHFSDDHSWAFLCGTTDRPDDGRVIAMSQARSLDDSLREVADLPPGWIARRDDARAPWTREPEEQA